MNQTNRWSALPASERSARSWSLSKIFQFGRYILVSSSRPAANRPNLQDDGMKICCQLGSKYTINVNTEWTIGPLSNKPVRCHMPCLTALRLSETGQKMQNYTMRRWVAHITLTCGRYCSCDAARMVCAGWWKLVCRHIWEHYFIKRGYWIPERILSKMKGSVVSDGHNDTEPNTTGWLFLLMSPERDICQARGSRVFLFPSLNGYGIIRDLFPPLYLNGKTPQCR